ncbi:MAG: alpha/beta hydrolase-fold protein, partial [Cellulomonadaceae bacterium]
MTGGTCPGTPGTLAPAPRPTVAEVFRTGPDQRRERAGTRARSPLITGLLAQGPRETERRLRELAARTGTPLVEPGDAGRTILTFLADAPDAAAVVLVRNNPVDGSTLAESSLERVAGTGLWHLSLEIGSGWRGSYALAAVPAAPSSPPHDPGAPADLAAHTLATYTERRRAHALARVPAADRAAVEQWFDAQRYAAPDPWGREQLNERSSVAAGPDAPGGLGSTGTPAAGPHGALHLVGAHRPGRSDRIAVHVPATPAPPGGWGVLVLLDGQDWIGARVTTVLDALAASGRIRPMLTVLVGGSDDPWRVRDLMCDADYVDFLADRVLSDVGERWTVSPLPQHTAIAGQSLGGLTAVYAQALRPDRFGASISQSGAFWWPHADLSDPDSQWLTRAIVAGGLRLNRVWLEVGTKEPGQVTANRHLAAALHGRAQVTWREYDGGHDRACWRAGLAEAILGTLGAGAGAG